MTSIELPPSSGDIAEELKETKKKLVPEIRKGTQVLGTDNLESRSLRSTDEEIEERLPEDFRDFKKEQEFDLAEAKRNLDRTKSQIDAFVKNMESDWKEWRNKVNETKDFDYFKKDFETFSQNVLANYSETRQSVRDKWQEFYDLYQSLNNFEENAETEFGVTSEAGKAAARYKINMSYGPLLVDYLQTFQNYDERLASLEKQWTNLTGLFNKNVIEKSKAEYRDYKRMEKIEKTEKKDSEDFDLEIKTVDEYFDLRADNAKKVESLWSKYKYTENIYQFLKSFLATKNFDVSEGDLYEHTDLEYALISDLALGKNTKLSGWSTGQMLEYYYSLPEKYSVAHLMAALAAFQRGEIKKRYEDKNLPIDEKALNQDSYYLKIIKELADTPEPLERLSKKSGDTIPPMQVNKK